MKKSKSVVIGLLALSVASCTSSKKRQDLEDYQTNANYYVDNGAGYNHGGISPFWVYWAYNMGLNGRAYSSPVYIHQSYGRNGTYHASSMGSTQRISSRGISSKGAISHSSVSRGGFGQSGRSISS